MNLFDKFAQPLRPSMPEQLSMDDYLEETVLPKVRPWSEDLKEEKFYLNKSWMELSDDLNFHQSVLHFFNSGGEYLKSEDGEITHGSWRYLKDSNKFMILDEDGDGELFDLGFLDDDFLIFRKQGHFHKPGRKAYLFLMHEPLAKKTEWREALEVLYDKAGRSVGYYIILGIAILLVIAMFYLL
jgi:hypothetical protein